MLMLIILALNYSVSMLVAPQYATFGPQTFCDRLTASPLEQPDCSNTPDLIKPCSELSDNPVTQRVCTPTILSTFINRITLNFPFFGVVFFWAQFFFLGKSISGTIILNPSLSLFIGLYLVVFVTSLFRSPKLDERQLDEDAEEAEEEGLLASTGRRFDASWQDITGGTGHNRRSPS